MLEAVLIRIKTIDLVSCLSGAMDLISPAVGDHHKRVGYMAARLGEELGLAPEERSRLLLAGMVHDAGAFSLATRLDALKFETDSIEHAEIGFNLFRAFPALAEVAGLVRHHHRWWQACEGASQTDDTYLGSLLCLADRADTLLNREGPVRTRLQAMLASIRPHAGTRFDPVAVEALCDLAVRSDFVEDLEQGRLMPSLPAGLPHEYQLDACGVLEFTRAMSQVIDFRCRFTATHSRGVATSAVALARLAGFSAEELVSMETAGNLHDLGKLAVPSEIIVKPAALTKEEFAVIRRHPLHGYGILAQVKGLEVVALWAMQHHERLNGQGYPFGLKGEQLSLGSRVMAVADVFTAVAEDRPYRPGMSRQSILRVLDDMAGSAALDPDVVGLARKHFDELNWVRAEGQRQALAEFRLFFRALSMDNPGSGVAAA